MKRFMPSALLACALLLTGAGCTGAPNDNAYVGTNPSPVTQTPPNPVPPVTTPSVGAPVPTMIAMYGQNASGESGTAVLTPLTDGKTKVVLSITGAPEKVPQPAHIHVGTCAKLGAITLPLSPVVNGMSTTVLDTGLDAILSATTSMAINVHKSAAEPKAYVACGDITK